jgi:hypothetical protein
MANGVLHIYTGDWTKIKLVLGVLISWYTSFGSGIEIESVRQDNIIKLDPRKAVKYMTS